MQSIYFHSSYLTFRNILIPKRATVHYAVIRFTAQSNFQVVNNNDVVKMMICGHDTDDSEPPTTAAQAEGMDRTTNCINWDDIVHWTDDTTYDSVDVACVVQEIVDREGWASGNNITLFVEDYNSDDRSLEFIGRRAYDYSDTPANAAQLLVYYTMDEVMDGGVVCGGSASSYKSFISETAEGVLCAGSTSSAMIFQPVISGGVLAAGNANNVCTYNVSVAAVGAIANGSANYGLIFNQTVSAVGTLAGGSASVEYHSAPIIISNGVLAAGTTTILATYNNAITPSGVQISGAATILHYPAQLESAGVLAAGTASVSDFGTTIITPNGLLANSTSPPSVVITFIVAPNGLLAASSAPALVKYNPEITSSGVAADGTSTTLATYNNAITASGVQISGQSQNTAIYNTVTIPNGVVATGSPTIFVSYNNDITPNGVLIAGTITLNQVFQPTASGGARLAGTSTVTSYVNEPANGLVQGGVKTSGLARVTQPVRHSYPTGDTIILASATIYKPIGFHPTYVTTGQQIVMGGAAISAYGITWSSTGGITMGSAPVLKASYITTGRGKVTISGDTEIGRGAYYVNPDSNDSVSIVLGSLTVASFTVPCRNLDIPCKINQTGDGDCPSIDFYYTSTFVRNPSTPRGQGAYLPAITKCRQTVPSGRRRRTQGSVNPFS